jgi:hypothetical protein
MTPSWHAPAHEFSRAERDAAGGHAVTNCEPPLRVSCVRAIACELAPAPTVHCSL